MGISGSIYRGMDTLLALEGSHCLPSPLNLPRAPSPIVVSVAVRASVSMSLTGMISQSDKITLPFILKVERMCPKLVTTKNSIDKQSDIVTSTMHMIGTQRNRQATFSPYVTSPLLGRTDQEAEQLYWSVIES